LRWTVLDTICSAQDPEEDRAHSIDKEENPSDRSQEYIQRCEPIGVVDKSDTEGEKNPADNIVSNASSKDSHANGG
jgi:hypothetical protein